MNNQNWEKKGLFFKPNPNLKWQKSHAAIPSTIRLKKNLYRTYFNSRDYYNKSYVSYFDWDITTKKILSTIDKPVLFPGEYGYFDDHGVQVTSLIRFESKIYMYYIGWNPGLKSPLFYTAIGLAISGDNGKTFQKYSKAPIMERSEYDPWMVSGGTVIKDEKMWRMYYISGQKMSFNNKNVESFYDIKYAESNDGISWVRGGIICIPLKNNETNISRISILKQKNYMAWYPFKKREENYRIGYAESIDGVNWNRKDELVKLNTSETGWDSQALDKAEVIQGHGEKVMLYNGNNFGYDGIGIATLKD